MGGAAAGALVGRRTLVPEAVNQLQREVPRARPTEDGAEMLALIPTILLARFNDRPLQEICAMAGLTVDDFTQSVAYREIFGLGEAQEAARVTLRQLNRRCGPLSDATTAQIQALPLEQLEALADALLDFQGPADLAAWLAAHT
jgi:predicted transposase YdaD